MATIMEKDVLLEYASFGYLIDDETEEGEQDLNKMHEIKEYLYDTNYIDIDYESIKEKIKILRQKYEN
ncbi:hypothetical protein [Campylobacter canadensis]|uniref:Uncharacterized protein n=1 Tax=Campylobacter canadensis TaxID=449520 RepID=A0ABS7WT55_9BACT|nr:hypothetical protein [Campylobacter canadensis]MBZ7987961.1 hypothetical protein [Campylobacter canadensis]MBZ7995408.1 hypothetical protein [Campylobacter canadensis]MBZ7997044.1 hypothetical protein [Campylobacter canadensis]MBZ7998919.1 hypothetical protein [Campylobacter canadensis]MBZ8000587.1 hypothetical protein [Campylobacter canadensis]